MERRLGGKRVEEMNGCIDDLGLYLFVIFGDIFLGFSRV